MMFGNFPKYQEVPVQGKRYWQIAAGTRALPDRWFEGGWRAFEFVIMKPYDRDVEIGRAHPYSFRIRFAYWLPFYFL